MDSQQAQVLNQQFTALNQALIQYIKGCSEADLDQVTGNEQWTVRIAAHHIGVSHKSIADMTQAVANGVALPPLTMDMFHQVNAQHAQEFADVSKAEVLAALDHGESAASAIVTNLSDEQLARVGHVAAFGADMSAQQVIENVLIWHTAHHFDSIKATLGKQKTVSEQ